MRMKSLLIALVLVSLACTANVTIVQTPTASPQATATPVSTPISVPPLEGMPIVIPGEIASLDMLDAQNGWMITDRFVLRSMDGGATWHDVTPRDTTALGYGVGASFLDADHGWVLIGDSSDPVEAGTLYTTSDGGIQWSTRRAPFGSGELHFLDASNGWVMINVGNGIGNMAVRFYQTSDGGVSWTQAYSNLPGDPGANDSLPFVGMKSGFTPVSMQEAWVSGRINDSNTVYLYHTTDGGQTWAAVTPSVPAGAQDMIQTYPPIFFGSQIGLLPTMSNSSTFFLITQDHGATWTAGAPVSGSGLSSVVSPNDIFVLFNGVLSVSNDASQTWTSIIPNMDVASNTIVSFEFVDTQTGWVVLSDANMDTSLYKTTDGGQTWAVQLQ